MSQSFPTKWGERASRSHAAAGTIQPADADARAALIHRVAPLRAVPGLPAPLHLADAPVPVWEAVEAQERRRCGPPFWAHLWPGSWALALHVGAGGDLRGRRVLDFACGGGAAGLAAAWRGAEVLAADVDPYAAVCAGLNAAAWEVPLSTTEDDLVGRDDGWDVVLVGDVFYERDLAARVAGWLDGLVRRGAQVLVGDPGRSFFPQGAARLVATTPVPLSAAWDSVLDRPARVWEWTGR